MNTRSAHRGLVATLLAAAASFAAPAPSLAHGDGAAHTHNAPHERSVDPTRFTTSRDAGAVLPVPSEDDSFFFAVFGDRTGGPAEGVAVLRDAVRDANLLEPDLVMTVGDLIQGYNRTEPWMAEMREYKSIMDGLLCPWFPVAGNHDVYWRPSDDPDKPAGEHEASYEMHFGPLWYAFEHKDCWFIALYSDEGNPQTGEKDFRRPDCQRMSPEQLAWLQATLLKAKNARHVFVFLHHPRWLGGNYGDDWEKVHRLLAAAGNVSAVFAGHIHRMRYDGPRDGIEYVTLATVGGGQSFAAPEAGYLHHFHTVTVRDDQIAMASIPVGEVMDVREITGALSDDCRTLSRLRPTFDGAVTLERDGAAAGSIGVRVRNPVSRPIEVTVAPESADSRWSFTPDHNHAVLGPGDLHEFTFHVGRINAGGVDEALRLPEVSLACEYLTTNRRYPVPATRTAIPLQLDLAAPARPRREAALSLDGRDDHARVESADLDVPDGPLTVECWFKARALDGRTGLIAKTENSEYGVFVSNAEPVFSIFIGDRYLNARGERGSLSVDRWTHIAGVYDGEEARLYVDGRLVAAAERRGERRTNDLPFMIGADVTGRAGPTSHFDGLIDAVRISRVARYTGGAFEPQRRFAPDADDALLLNMDAPVGPWLYDESGDAAHAIRQGGAEVAPAG